jgi:hypothetical protein
MAVSTYHLSWRLVLPVHHDDVEEYHARREKDALLKSLGIGQDPDTLGQMETSLTSKNNTGGRVRENMSTVVKREPDVETFQHSMLRLLRVLVLQNELILRILRLKEGTVKGPLKPFNPIDWK